MKETWCLGSSAESQKGSAGLYQGQLSCNFLAWPPTEASGGYKVLRL